MEIQLYWTGRSHRTDDLDHQELNEVWNHPQTDDDEEEHKSALDVDISSHEVNNEMLESGVVYLVEQLVPDHALT